MKIVSTVGELRAELRHHRAQSKRIGLVPTMGYLHAGHVSLFAEASQRCDVVVASIFVNPLQFGPSEDLAVYPRNPDGDAAAAAAAGVDVLFMPSAEEMYPQTPLVTMTVQEIHRGLCGSTRPGHFEGVATVVAKLFNIVQPQVAFFGQKDAQQLAVIRQMALDLNYDIEICACPIVRETDGLAMSSRNVYLTAAERQQAPVIYRALARAQQLVDGGETDAIVLLDSVRDTIRSAAEARIEYVDLVAPDTLRPLSSVSGLSLLAVAVRFGRTRLIDNIVLHPAENILARHGQGSPAHW